MAETKRFFVSCDFNRMAKAFDHILHDIIEEQGDISNDQAVDYVKHLKNLN